MRISARTEDPGYSQKAHHCRVLVDGINVTNRCHTADEEKGMAWCNKLNAKGQPYVEFISLTQDGPTNHAAIAEEILHGKVEISFNQEPT